MAIRSSSVKHVAGVKLPRMRVVFLSPAFPPEMMQYTAELEAALQATRAVPEASCEEYVEGEEFTFDTVCIDAKPAFENIAAYLPKPLEARSQEWVSPVIITVRDMDQERLAPGVELGRKVLAALGMGDGFTHMEWFLTAAAKRDNQRYAADEAWQHGAMAALARRHGRRQQGAGRIL
jgi:hypothetical protein